MNGQRASAASNNLVQAMLAANGMFDLVLPMGASSCPAEQR
jgi:hypothetical protein